MKFNEFVKTIDWNCYEKTYWKTIFKYVSYNYIYHKRIIDERFYEIRRQLGTDKFPILVINKDNDNIRKSYAWNLETIIRRMRYIARGNKLQRIKESSVESESVAV